MVVHSSVRDLNTSISGVSHVCAAIIILDLLLTMYIMGEYMLVLVILFTTKSTGWSVLTM